MSGQSKARPVKSLQTRLDECKSIKLQLQSLGVLTDPFIQRRLRDAMNNFVSMNDPIGSIVHIPVDANTQLQLQLSLTTRSGISLVKC